MFTGQEDHLIPLDEAAALTRKFRQILMPLLGGIKAEYFGKTAIQTVLNQENVVGIRIYYGLSADIVPLPQLVIVGVNAAGEDITTGIILERGRPCPPECSSVNVLNT